MTDLVYRKVPEDEATLTRTGNVLVASAKRKVQGTLEELEAKERVPLHVMKWPIERQTRYLSQVAVRLRRELDRMERGAHPQPNRKMRRRALSINKIRKEKPMSRVLNSRLMQLIALADLKGLPDYHEIGPENHGFANGLRCAVAMMQGKDFEPLLCPEKWRGSPTPAGTGAEALEAQKTESSMPKADVPKGIIDDDMAHAQASNAPTLAEKPKRAPKAQSVRSKRA